MKNLVQAASYDDLTGVKNRKQFIADTEKAIDYSFRKDLPYALIILDIDYFKSINDTYGHRKGDDLLRHLTGILGKELRHYDNLGRFGGDEFMIFLQDTDCEDSLEIATRLKRVIQKNPLDEIEFTVSMGLVCVGRGREKADSFYDLYHESDLALYQVKNNGRNGVVQVMRK